MPGKPENMEVSTSFKSLQASFTSDSTGQTEAWPELPGIPGLGMADHSFPTYPASLILS